MGDLDFIEYSLHSGSVISLFVDFLFKIFFLILSLLALFKWAPFLIIKFNRNKLKKMPTPIKWNEILSKNFQVYQFLPETIKYELHDLMKIFINEKKFKGIEIEITEEMIVTVSAQACLLLLNKKHNFYPYLAIIYIYPDLFKAQTWPEIDNLKEKRGTIWAGMSWVRGPVALSWRSTLSGLKNNSDGNNVVIHEFAHQLDQEDGNNDGMPPLTSPMNFQIWASVMEKSFVKFTDSVLKKEKTLLSAYGATNKAEFFAVLTENFFEKPTQLQKEHKELYELLKQYFGLDPITWEKQK